MRRNHAVVTLAGFFAILTLPCLAFGAPVELVPTGLNPGDQYRLVFVTSTTTTATSGQISDYDQFVNDAANASGSLLESLGATWQAIVSTSNISAANHIGTFSVPVFLVDGVEVATGSQQLWSGQILAPISVDEQGNAAAPFVWTGTGPNGGQDDPLGQSPASIGCTTINTSQWIDLEPPDSKTNSDALPVYGISSILTVPVTEPWDAGVIIAAALLLINTRTLITRSSRKHGAAFRPRLI